MVPPKGFKRHHRAVAIKFVLAEELQVVSNRIDRRQGLFIGFGRIRVAVTILPPGRSAAGAPCPRPDANRREFNGRKALVGLEPHSKDGTHERKTRAVDQVKHLS
jgi:hypothetical protein